MKLSPFFWNASLEELKNGFIETEEAYQCLLCSEKIEKGIVYSEDGVMYEASRYIRIHIEKAHGSVFDYLTGLDKKYTGLTEHQNRLLSLFYQGKSDDDVKREMGIGSAATIRNHRFVLKEKERQARVFLAIMELLKDRDKKTSGLIPPHSTAKMVDDRYHVTEDENEKILKKYFTQGLNGPIKTFDMKEKSKLVVLRQIVKRFEPNRIYTEKEVNQILKTAYEDHVTLRRYLIEYGFFDRKPDGSQYWLQESSKEMKPVSNTDRKKELKERYKELKPEAGIFQIKNTKNQKILLMTTPNLKMINGKRRQLIGGNFPNQELQKEWKEYGEESFAFEVLEVLPEHIDDTLDKNEALKRLEQKWLAKLEPFGERGYHKQK